MPEHSWPDIQRKIVQAFSDHSVPKPCQLNVYWLLRAAICITTDEENGTVAQIRLQPDALQSLIEIRIERPERVLYARTLPNELFGLESGEQVDIQQFCSWLFSLVCEVSRAHMA